MIRMLTLNSENLRNLSCPYEWKTMSLNSLNGLRLSALGHAEINMSQNYFVRRIIMRNFLFKDKKANKRNNFSDSYLICNRLCHELDGTHKIKFLKQASGAPVINLCFYIKWKVYWFNWTRGKTIKQVLFNAFCIALNVANQKFHKVNFLSRHLTAICHVSWYKPVTTNLTKCCQKKRKFKGRLVKFPG